jgi:type II secretory pathway pseudopilin PulG
MLKFKANFRNSPGISIIELLVAVGIMGIVAVGLMSLLDLGLRGTKAIDQDIAATNITEQIRGLLGNPKACMYTLGAGLNKTSFTSPTVYAGITNIKDKDDVPIFEVTTASAPKIYEAFNIKIERIDLTTDVSVGNTPVLKINYLKSNTQSLGTKSYVRPIYLSVTYDGAGVVIGCVSLAKMTDGIWSLIPGTNWDIQYRGGNVFVGPSPTASPLASPLAVFNVTGGVSVEQGGITVGNPIDAQAANIAFATPEGTVVTSFPSAYGAPRNVLVGANGVEETGMGITVGTVPVGSFYFSTWGGPPPGNANGAPDGYVAMQSYGPRNLYFIVWPNFPTNFGNITAMTIQNATGNVEISKSLTVSGALAVSGTLTVSGDANIGGNVTTQSDEKIKKDLKPLENALDKILKIKAYYFRWKNEGKGKSLQLGLKAQEVEKVFPELVTTDVKGIKSIAYQNLVAPLIETVHEMDARLKLQEKDNRELRAQFKLYQKAVCELSAKPEFCK